MKDMCYEVRRAEACVDYAVCPSRASEREGERYCVKGGWREGEERVRRSVNPIPNPDPNPTQAPQMSRERGLFIE